MRQYATWKLLHSTYLTLIPVDLASLVSVSLCCPPETAQIENGTKKKTKADPRSFYL